MLLQRVTSVRVVFPANARCQAFVAALRNDLNKPLKSFKFRRHLQTEVDQNTVVWASGRRVKQQDGLACQLALAITCPAMRDKLGGRKTPQKLIEFTQEFWLSCHSDLCVACIGLAQKSAGVQKLVYDIEMECDFSHVLVLEPDGVFLDALVPFKVDLTGPSVGI